MVAIQLPRPIPTRSTNDYYNVIREADTSGPGSFGGQQPDGALNNQELTQYSQRLTQQKQFIDLFGNFFQSFLGYNPFAQYAEQLNGKLEIANTLQNNFNAFDGGNRFAGGTTTDGRISYRDVYDVARTDGNPSDVSNQDIRGGFGPFPPGPRIPLNYNDNAQLTQRIRELLPQNGSPYSGTLTSLVDSLATLEPESPQASAVQARIAAIAPLAGVSDQNLQSAFTLNALRALNNTTGSLTTISGNLEPESPQSQALQGRLSAIQGVRTSLIQTYERLNPA